MASVVFYFQVHQPCRLKRYSVFDNHPFYFDAARNGEICRKVAEKCYRPATRLVLELVREHKGNFRVTYSLSGVVLEQLQEFCPDVIDLFRALAETGCCEFLGETYHHSLAFLYSRQEFIEQVRLHTRLIERLFGQTPRVFRNTELIYSNDVARVIGEFADDKGERRFSGILCEGADRVLGYRSPNYVYRPPGGAGAAGARSLGGSAGRGLGLLLKNYRLSDDIAFRFGNRAWPEWPLTAEKFARWVNQINGDGYLCNLFMDYETLGEHQWADTGIFEFLRALPGAIFDVSPGQNHFNTPSEALERFEAVGEYDVPQFISWADTERDLTAWRGNAMQANALEEVFRLERPIKSRVARAEASGDEEDLAAARQLLDDWRKLTTSDHYYYMCTKYFADGDVHKYFNPYDSPYDSYINVMNVLDNLRTRAMGERAAPVPAVK